MAAPKELRAHSLYKIGLIGTNNELKDIAEFMEQDAFKSVFPWIQLAGVVVHNGEPPAFSESVPLFPNHIALLEEHPDLDMIFEMSKDQEFLQELRRNMPPQISVLNSKSSFVIWNILRFDAMRSDCEVDLQYAQSLFRTVFDEVEEDIILLDLEGRIADMNKNAHTRKQKHKADLLGQYCWELEGRKFCCEQKSGDCPFKQTRTTGVKADSVHTYVDDDGRMCYVRVYAYPIFNAAKELTHIMEIRRDITNRTNLELRLQQSEKMAAIGELSTYIAHEIRNPLFAIGGFANSLLRSESLDDTAREKVSIILEESKRLDKILKSTLNFARPTDAKAGHVDLNTIVTQTMELLSFGFEQQNITLKQSISPEIAIAKCDPELIKQCLINLVKNGVEAMPAGGVLAVTTRMHHNFIALDVEDSGKGIPKEIREKVFNPFFSTKEKGAGLGLAMTKKILQEMGGSVELHSPENKGARITLLIPPVLAVNESPYEDFA